MAFNDNMKKFFEEQGITPMFTHSMTTEEILETCSCTIDEDGDVYDENGNFTGFNYDDLAY